MDFPAVSDSRHAEGYYDLCRIPIQYRSGEMAAAHNRGTYSQHCDIDISQRFKEGNFVAAAGVAILTILLVIAGGFAYKRMKEDTAI